MFRAAATLLVFRKTQGYSERSAVENNEPAQPMGYAEVALRLRALATSARDPDVAAQLTELAVQYAVLAEKAGDIADKYLPMVTGVTKPLRPHPDSGPAPAPITRALTP